MADSSWIAYVPEPQPVAEPVNENTQPSYGPTVIEYLQKVETVYTQLGTWYEEMSSWRRSHCENMERGDFSVQSRQLLRKEEEGLRWRLNQLVTATVNTAHTQSVQQTKPKRDQQAIMKHAEGVRNLAKLYREEMQAVTDARDSLQGDELSRSWEVKVASRTIAENDRKAESDREIAEEWAAFTANLPTGSTE